MIEKIKSVSYTEGIKIEAVAEFIQQESKPEQGLYAYAYKIRVTNEGDEWARLISRYWLIINSDGKETEVEGPGVVGYFPAFEKGQTFEYMSWSPLDTEWGTMEGYFVLERKDGSRFNAMINRFYLTTASVMTLEKL